MLFRIHLHQRNPSGITRDLWSKMTKTNQDKIAKLVASIVATAALSGCADGNIHQFLNSDFLNTVAPSVATTGKAFYPERYSPLLPVKIPVEFGKQAPDRIGPWVFYGFSGDAKENSYQANYYDPSSIKVSGSQIVVSAFTFYSNTRYTRSKKPFLSTVFQYTLDCKNRTFKYNYITAYATNRAEGYPVSKNDLTNTFKPVAIEDGSSESILLGKVCS